ncbi:hypothetical protein [Chitinophaga nivalis]|uniref:Uncharacterized protein n=1 Tax=Chitinophaga nivalis TaxID=2991709 RepID=A0ABT3IN24_9BACT|nr:hypothetical protein [Chitinophaga nivalis]MCW3465123.1 hypothetical protein [Chitinophaga nivalis]MCW3485185.1 hypothetical protein [Chitinophaga nivalis]
MNLKSFISNEILRIDNHINTCLLKTSIDILVKKEVVYGKKNSFILHSLEGGKKEVCTFSISYTFKEDIEETNGQRPNDITLSIILLANDKKNYTVNQEIIFGTGFDNIEFKVVDIDNIANENFEQRLNFDELRKVFEVSIVNFMKLLCTYPRASNESNQASPSFES